MWDLQLVKAAPLSPGLPQQARTLYDASPGAESVSGSYRQCLDWPPVEQADADARDEVEAVPDVKMAAMRTNLLVALNVVALDAEDASTAAFRCRLSARVSGCGHAPPLAGGGRDPGMDR